MEMMDKRLADRDANTPFQIIGELFNVFYLILVACVYTSFYMILLNFYYVIVRTIDTLIYQARFTILTNIF